MAFLGCTAESWFGGRLLTGCSTATRSSLSSKPRSCLHREHRHGAGSVHESGCRPAPDQADPPAEKSDCTAGELGRTMARAHPRCERPAGGSTEVSWYHIARNTVKSILLENGLEPAPERGRRTSWHTFIKSHLGVIAGADLFTVEVLRGFGLVRYFVLFVIDIGTRRVHVAGITSQPSEAWMKQIARNLTDGVGGFLKQTRYLILDRDPLYTRTFREMLKAGWRENRPAAGAKSGSECVCGALGAVGTFRVSISRDPAWRATSAASSDRVPDPLSPREESPRAEQSASSRQNRSTPTRA